MNTALSDTELDQLAAAITQRLARPIPLDIDLWSAKEVALFLKVGPRQVTERYALSEEFPKAIRLPSVAGVRGVPRWRAFEVVAWAERHREGTPMARGGRPRQVA